MSEWVGCGILIIGFLLGFHLAWQLQAMRMERWQEEMRQKSHQEMNQLKKEVELLFTDMGMKEFLRAQRNARRMIEEREDE